MQGNIIRVSKPERFTVLSHTMLRDSRLSFAARGLLSYLLSLPDNWEVRVSHLIEQSPAGRDAVYSIMRELVDFGYMSRMAVRDQATGRISHYETLVRESPDNPPVTIDESLESAIEASEMPHTDKPETALPDTDSHPPKNNIIEEIPKKEIPRERRTQNFAENPAVTVFREIYGILPTIFQQEQITTDVQDSTIWRRVITKLKLNGTPAKNVGTMLEVYKEALLRVLQPSSKLSELVSEGGLV